MMRETSTKATTLVMIMIDQAKYRIQCYQIILVRFAEELTKRQLKAVEKGNHLTTVKITNLTLKYAQECFALENADLDPPDADEENGEHGGKPF